MSPFAAKIIPSLCYFHTFSLTVALQFPFFSSYSSGKVEKYIYIPFILFSLLLWVKRNTWQEEYFMSFLPEHWDFRTIRSIRSLSYLTSSPLPDRIVHNKRHHSLLLSYHSHPGVWNQGLEQIWPWSFTYFDLSVIVTYQVGLQKSAGHHILFPNKGS